MKICQVVTGIIPVPNNRWGAVEKIIWEYKTNLENEGHECDVKYLNEVRQGQYDIVHIHMANLCIEAQKRGLDYVFSIHDHHVEHHGEGSYIYEMNREAMKNSIFSITHAPHYLELFYDVDKLFYLRHGVNTKFFTRRPLFQDGEKILMVANNGLAGDYGIDRKGFELGICAAKALDLPITIIGAEANQRFFELRPDLVSLHDKLTVIYDNPTDDVVRDHYHSNTIFLHPSFLEAGHPNLTLLEAAACSLKVVATYKGDFPIKGLYRIENLSVEDVTAKIKQAIDAGVDDYVSQWMASSALDWRYVVSELSQYYSNVENIKKDFSTDEIKSMLHTVYRPYKRIQ